MWALSPVLLTTCPWKGWIAARCHPGDRPVVGGSKKWLAPAKEDGIKAGLKPERQAAESSRRLGDARDPLKWQFKFFAMNVCGPERNWMCKSSVLYACRTVVSRLPKSGWTS